MSNEAAEPGLRAAGAGRGTSGQPRLPSRKIDPFALALVVLLFAEHLVFGANRGDLAVAFAVAHFLLLLALLVVSKGAEPPRLPLLAPAILLEVVFALGLFSLLPLGPPLAHPLWAYAQAAGAKAPATISLQPFATRLELVKLAGFVALFLSAAAVGARREGSEAMGRYLTIAGILYCLWAAVAFVVDPHTVFGTARPFGDRLSGSFFSANSAATLFASLTILGLTGVLAPLMRPRKPDERLKAEAFLKAWPEGLLALTALSCLLMSGSRGGLLALCAAGLVVLAATVWMNSAKRSLIGGLVSVLCVALTFGVAVFLLGGQHTAARFDGANPLTEDRLTIFAAYWPTIVASPWLGYGLGAFPSVNAISMTGGSALILSSLGAAHDVYLQWLLQEGFPGALAMFGSVGLILIATAKGVSRRQSQRWLGVACLGIAAVFAVHGLVDFALEEPSLAAFFSAMLGLGFGLAERPAGSRRRG
jgi:O-antigen ligase